MKFKVNPFTGKFDLLEANEAVKSAIGDLEARLTAVETVAKSNGDDIAALQAEDHTCYYSDAENATTVTVGGVTEGHRAFDKTPVADVIDALLHKPQLTLSLSPGGCVREYGTTYTPGTVTATATAKSCEITSISISGPGEPGEYEKGAAQRSMAVPAMTHTTTYTAQAAGTANMSARASVTYSFFDPVYYGLLPEGAELTWEAVSAMRKVQPSGNGTFRLPYPAFGSESLRLVVATTGQVAKMLDPNSFDFTSSFTLTATVTDGKGDEWHVVANNLSKQEEAFPCQATITGIKAR